MPIPPIFQGAALPLDFAALPSAERQRILEAGREMTEYTFRHATAITIGVPPSQGSAIRSGSAFLVHLDGQYFVATAWHIVEYWVRMVRRIPKLLFQVGNAELNPHRCLAWHDVDRDLAFLSITDDERALIPCDVCEATRGWPPPAVEVGQFVLLAGFPGVIRERPRSGTLQFNSMSAMLQVTSVRDDYIVCQFTREHWVTFGPHGVPAPHTDLGGLSGAPVLLVGNLDYPVVALVSEFSLNFELLYLSPLNGVPAVW